MEIKYTDLSYEVYKRLKTMILSNDFQPGEKLKQEHIAQMFGVSRMPLHKAFQMLENEMLVENLPRRGFYVTKIDYALMLDAFECREALEGIAIRRATLKITREDLNFLQGLFAPFNPKNIDEKQYVVADQEFHNAILRISGNQVLQKFEVIKNITSQTYRGGLIRSPQETLPEHLAIINAMEKGDAERAEILIREHSRKTQALILSEMENKNK